MADPLSRVIADAGGQNVEVGRVDNQLFLFADKRENRLDALLIETARLRPFR